MRRLFVSIDSILLVPKLLKSDTWTMLVCRGKCMPLPVILILLVRKNNIFAIQGHMNMNHIFIFLNITEAYIMNEICQQFPTALRQYACVSMDYYQSTATLRPIYIQILLRKVVNKNGWFLDKVTGTYDRCRTRSYSLETIHNRWPM